MMRCLVTSKLYTQSNGEPIFDESNFSRLRCSLEAGHEGNHPLVALPRCGIIDPPPKRGPVVGMTCTLHLDEDGRCPEHGYVVLTPKDLT